jgi:hypothetical protein
VPTPATPSELPGSWKHKTPKTKQKIQKTPKKTKKFLNVVQFFQVPKAYEKIDMWAGRQPENWRP